MRSGRYRYAPCMQPTWLQGTAQISDARVLEIVVKERNHRLDGIIGDASSRGREFYGEMRRKRRRWLARRNRGKRYMYWRNGLWREMLRNGEKKQLVGQSAEAGALVSRGVRQSCWRPRYRALIKALPIRTNNRRIELWLQWREK